MDQIATNTVMVVDSNKGGNMVVSNKVVSMVDSNKGDNMVVSNKVGIMVDSNKGAATMVVDFNKEGMEFNMGMGMINLDHTVVNTVMVVVSSKASMVDLINIMVVLMEVLAGMDHKAIIINVFN